MQSWCTTFPIWSHSIVPCPVQTVTSWPACRFLRRQARCSGRQSALAPSLYFPQFVMIHTVKIFGVATKAEIGVFLELTCFFDDPTHVDNLLSGSSATSKSSLYIWKFSVHELLKPVLENFEHYFANMWDEFNCMVIEHSLALLSLGLECKLPFQPCALCWVFQICSYIEGSTSRHFRIWNSSTGIPSPPLVLFNAS